MTGAGVWEGIKQLSELITKIESESSSRESTVQK